MSLGRMTTSISIVKHTTTYDSEGFSTQTDVAVKDTRAYREGRHGSTAWRNRASFTTATDLFIIRNPGVKITTDMVIICDGDSFNITSVENIKGRGMYLEILAEEVKPSGEDDNTNAE